MGYGGVLSTAAREITEKEILVTVDGVAYDVSNWINLHPGGDVITKYNNKDATDVFYALHGEEGIEKLKLFKSNNKERIAKPAPRSAVFQRFRQKVIDAGLMKTDPFWYSYKIATTLFLVYFGAYLIISGWSIVGAIMMGLGWQQMGWLGHEMSHHQIFPNRNVNRFFGYLMGNVVQGFSQTWWNDRHNTHHAITNVLDSDPDIDNLPLFAWSEHDIERMAPFVKKYMIPYQHYYFLIFCPFLKIIWQLQSFFFVLSLDKAPNKKYASYSNVEKATILLHWLWVFYVLIMAENRFWVFVISEGIPGFGIAIIVFFNHYTCTHYKDTKAEFDFLDLIFATTRNMTPSVFKDWICGGLNFQIEHHMFPTLPRHNLTKCRVMVKQFCKENNIEYKEQGFFEGVGLILETLKGVAMTVRKMNAHSD